MAADVHENASFATEDRRSVVLYPIRIWLGLDWHDTVLPKFPARPAKVSDPVAPRPGCSSTGNPKPGESIAKRSSIQSWNRKSQIASGSDGRGFCVYSRCHSTNEPATYLQELSAGGNMRPTDLGTSVHADSTQAQPGLCSVDSRTNPGYLCGRIDPGVHPAWSTKLKASFPQSRLAEHEKSPVVLPASRCRWSGK